MAVSFADWNGRKMGQDGWAGVRQAAILNAFIIDKLRDEPAAPNVTFLNASVSSTAPADRTTRPQP